MFMREGDDEHQRGPATIITVATDDDDTNGSDARDTDPAFDSRHWCGFLNLDLFYFNPSDERTFIPVEPTEVFGLEIERKRQLNFAQPEAYLFLTAIAAFVSWTVYSTRRDKNVDARYQTSPKEDDEESL